MAVGVAAIHAALAPAVGDDAADGLDGAGVRRLFRGVTQKNFSSPSVPAMASSIAPLSTIGFHVHGQEPPAIRGQPIRPPASTPTSTLPPCLEPGQAPTAGQALMATDVDYGDDDA